MNPNLAGMAGKFARRTNTINGINSVIQMGGTMYAASGAGANKTKTPKTTGAKV